MTANSPLDKSNWMPSRASHSSPHSPNPHSRGSPRPPTTPSPTQTGMLGPIFALTPEIPALQNSVHFISNLFNLSLSSPLHSNKKKILLWIIIISQMETASLAFLFLILPVSNLFSTQRGPFKPKLDHVTLPLKNLSRASHFTSEKYKILDFDLRQWTRLPLSHHYPNHYRTCI